MAAALLALLCSGLADRVVLLSHGSKRPEAGSQLAAIARDLRRAGQADVVAAAVFFGAGADEGGAGGDGPPAALDVALRRMLAEDGAGAIRVLPFILGPSRALRAEAPRIVRAAIAEHPGARIDVLPCLSDALGGDGIRCLARGMAEQVTRAMRDAQLARPLVLLCDHGSADPAVASVRQRMAALVAALLGDAVLGVEPAPMERPATLARGSEVDDPLLEERLAALGDRSAEVVVAMAFVSPGRHAGGEGDVAAIVRQAQDAQPRLAVHVTELLGDSAAVREMLASSVLAARAR